MFFQIFLWGVLFCVYYVFKNEGFVLFFRNQGGSKLLTRMSASHITVMGGGRRQGGATQQWPPRHYMSWPGRLLTCFFPAYLHLLTYFCLHTLFVTLRSAWERGELYLVLHCCVQLPHIEGASLVCFLNFSLSASETMWDNAQIQDRMSESGCQL